MTTYRFDKFVFDTDSYQLRADDVLIALRPKTAVLMAVLIEQRQHLLGKKALFSQVWQSDHVQHQSLFQAISEIRKILAPLQPIKTHPNLGYQWVAPVKHQRESRWLGRWTGRLPGRWMGRLAGAAMPLAAVSAVLVWYGQAPTQVTSQEMTQTPTQVMTQAPTQIRDTQANIIMTQSMLQSPAMRAFASGLEHLNKQQLTEAWDYFEIAERENPLFLEAGLMKAEILFERTDFLAAQTLTTELLARAVTQGEHYIEVSAQGLLSRISEQTGQWNNALDWALQADSNARDQGFACVAENTRIRIAGLLSESDLPVNKAWISNEHEVAEPPSKSDQVLANEYPDASHCESMQERSDADPAKTDLSQCLDTGSEYQSLAMLEQPVFTSSGVITSKQV